MLDWVGGSFDPDAFDPTEFKDNFALGGMPKLEF
jgi:hypothetical protein